jgi:hypothetical protein
MEVNDQELEGEAMEGVEITSTAKAPEGSGNGILNEAGSAAAS